MSVCVCVCVCVYANDVPVCVNVCQCTEYLNKNGKTFYKRVYLSFLSVVRTIQQQSTELNVFFLCHFLSFSNRFFVLVNFFFQVF